jgi:predicted ABC-type ATPase
VSKKLIVIAGCNGSGKSTYSKILTPSGILPFDYDKCFLDIYISKPDSELRERISHNLAFQFLENSIDYAIKNNLDFCYETNFNSSPLHWPSIFINKGYEINMIYFCLHSTEEAKKRVLIRFENGGHFVPDNEVEERFYSGYFNLNKYFKEFNKIILLDSSAYNTVPSYIATLEKGKLKDLNFFPDYIKPLLPNIALLIS